MTKETSKKVSAKPSTITKEALSTVKQLKTAPLEEQKTVDPNSSHTQEPVEAQQVTEEGPVDDIAAEEQMEAEHFEADTAVEASEEVVVENAAANQKLLDEAGISETDSTVEGLSAEELVSLGVYDASGKEILDLVKPVGTPGDSQTVEDYQARRDARAEEDNPGGVNDIVDVSTLEKAIEHFDSSEKEPEFEEVSRAASELPKNDRLDAIRPVRVPKTRKLGAHMPRSRQRPKDNTEPFVQPPYFGKKPLPQKLGTMGMKRDLAGRPPGLGSIDGKRTKF